MSHATALEPLSPSEVGFLNLESRDPLRYAISSYLARFSGTTLIDYARDLRVFLDWCDRHGLPVLKAKRGHIEMYVRYLEESGWASSTICRRVGVVAGLYKYALRDEVIEKDPCAWIDRPDLDRDGQKRTYLTSLEFGKWMGAAAELGPTEVALGAILGLRGLRIAEACRLNVEDLGRAGGYTTIPVLRKGGRVEMIVLPHPVAEAVQAAIGDRTTGPILLNQWGTRLDRAGATRMIREVCEHARITTRVSPHSFRRTFVTTGLSIGIPLRSMQQAAGHRSSHTTELYDMGGTNPASDAAHQLASHMAGIV